MQVKADRPLVLHTRVVTGFGGGPDKTIINSPRFLRNLGYESVCAYMHPPDDLGFQSLVERGQRANAEILSVPDRGALDWRVVRQLRKYCREHQVAIWHGHDYKSNALGLLLRRSWPMKLVSTVHGWGVQDTRRTSIYYSVDRFCLKRYDQVICVSEDLFQQCAAIGVRKDRLHHIANAIDVEEFRTLVDRTLPRDVLTIGAMGRLSAEKGFHHLIQAVAMLVEEGLSCRLIIGGEGDERQRLETLIADLGCGNYVTLLGHIDNIVDFYEQLDLFALSSIREGLPNVVLEAMSMQVPVVATRIAGVPHLVTHQENGWLIDPDSVEALADGIRSLLQSGTLRQELAGNARRHIEEQYSFSVRMEKMAKVYDASL